MSLFSYVVRHDLGFAPNPYGGLLTLATCKPRIRKTARKGDYLVGTGSAATVGSTRLVYAARVSEVVSLADYGCRPEFACKVPRQSGQPHERCGDNIYVCDRGRWQQRPNNFHDAASIERDLSGENALVCREFRYFGIHAIAIPEHLQWMIKKGPGHKRITDDRLIDSIVAWLRTLPMAPQDSQQGDAWAS
jgi:hypothetical protein